MFAFRIALRTSIFFYSKEMERHDYLEQIAAIFQPTVLSIEVSSFPPHWHFQISSLSFLCRYSSVVQNECLLSYFNIFIKATKVPSSFVFYVKHLHTRTTCTFTAGIRVMASLVLAIRDISTTDTAWNSKQTALDFHSSGIGITNCMYVSLHIESLLYSTTLFKRGSLSC